jgi:hypothetical protein
LAPFVDNVEDYVSTRDDVETTLRNFQEMISYVCSIAWNSARLVDRSLICVVAPFRKYQFMQANTERRAQGLREKIPDINKNLDMVQFLVSRSVGL